MADDDDVTGLCEWPVDLKCFPDDVKTGDPEVVQAAVDTATEVLWALTGRQFGVCPAEVAVRVDMCRPCAPTLFEGEWYNVDPSGRGWCTGVWLPGPIFEILSVEGEDGEPLRWAATEYGCDVIGSPVRVRYMRGRVVPPTAARMVGRLASQMYLQCTGRPCQLPARTSSVTRQGVSVQMADPMDIINAGGTGLPDVDMWIRAHNPHHLSAPSEVIG